MISKATKIKWSETERRMLEAEKHFKYFVEHGRLPFSLIKQNLMNELFKKYSDTWVLKPITK